MSDDAAAFRDEARFQRVCAETGASGPWHAHHVVEKKHCRENGWPLYDPRNALRLAYDTHMTGQTAAMRRVKTTNLLDCNIAFAVECMGSGRATDYLRRYYDDSDPDPRLIELERMA